MTYNKKLESQLQQTLSALNEMNVEKCKLQNDYNESLKKRKEFSSEIEKLKAERGQLQNQYKEGQKKCKELASEIEILKVSLNQKSTEWQSLKEKMQSRLINFEIKLLIPSFFLTQTRTLFSFSAGSKLANEKTKPCENRQQSPRRNSKRAAPKMRLW